MRPYQADLRAATPEAYACLTAAPSRRSARISPVNEPCDRSLRVIGTFAQADARSSAQAGDYSLAVRRTTAVHCAMGVQVGFMGFESVTLAVKPGSGP
jgi:hypothetical protein